MRPPKSSMIGFTLIEVLVSLTLFSLIIAIAYQSIISTATGRSLLVEKVDRQYALRAAHLTLKNAFSSGSLVWGDRQQIEFDLATSDTPWLLGTQKLMLTINKQGQLLAKLDNAADNSVLMNKLDQAAFMYHSNGVDQREWALNTLPDWAELSWTENGEQRRWRFACR